MLCQVCGNHTTLVLDLGNHPLCDDLIPLHSVEKSTTYPIKIRYCDNCHTAFQEFNVDKRTLFPSTYHYRSSMTADVLKGMQSLIDSLSSPSTDKTYLLDIGSNDGSLLDIAAKAGFKTVGVEPTDAHINSLGKTHHIYNNYFDIDVATQIRTEHGYPLYITFTNVFAHIEDFDSLLESLSVLIGPNTSVVIENHYLGSVIQRNQFDTFYHEHPRTYSLHSFHHIAKRLNLNLSHVEYPSRYGGNIRVHMSVKEPYAGISELLREDASVCHDIDSMQTKVNCWVNSKSSKLKSLVDSFGPLPSKAFPGRSAILYKLLNLTTDTISAAYEQNASQKIGHFIPGTNIPILPDSDLFTPSLDPSVPIINNAWHISHEIKLYLRSNGINNPIVDLIDPSDFADS